MSEVLAIHVNDKDTCVTVVAEVQPGDIVKYVLSDGTHQAVAAKDTIPVYHKIAIVSQVPGDFVIKYGHTIGIATQTIEAGEHVHIHNIKAAGLKDNVDGVEESKFGRPVYH